MLYVWVMSAGHLNIAAQLVGATCRSKPVFHAVVTRGGHGTTFLSHGRCVRFTTLRVRDYYREKLQLDRENTCP